MWYALYYKTGHEGFKETLVSDYAAKLYDKMDRHSMCERLVASGDPDAEWEYQRETTFVKVFVDYEQYLDAEPTREQLAGMLVALKDSVGETLHTHTANYTDYPISSIRSAARHRPDPKAEKGAFVYRYKVSYRLYLPDTGNTGLRSQCIHLLCAGQHPRQRVDGPHGGLLRRQLLH